ncbi:PQQ-dependent sugar dehydrogenase [Yinghuangia aomiensis]
MLGLSSPIDVEFAADGRVFVAEKSGIIKVFASSPATAPTVFADLRTQVHNYWDRGLLGMALAPNFPADPSVYVLYAYDAPPGKSALLLGHRRCRRGRLPQPARPADLRLRRHRPPVQTHRHRQHRRAGAGADHRLVPAVPVALHRLPGSSAPTATSTPPRATAPASTGRTTARPAPQRLRLRARIRSRRTRAATPPRRSAPR